MSARTKGPWSVDARKKKGTSKGYAYVLIRAPGALGQIATVFENHTANAEFIVRACNAHDELVAALRIIENCLADDEGGVTLGSYELGKVRAALSKV